MFEATHEEYRGQITFRDYLTRHGDVADEYAELKRSLARRFGRDWDAYTDGKGEFVRKVLAAARDSTTPGEPLSFGEFKPGSSRQLHLY